MKIHCAYQELADVGSLRPHPKNRNGHPDSQVERLAKILAYQGVRAPIVVSKRSGCIVKGHGTLAAIKKNGWTQAPVVFQDFDDEVQEYAFVQSDNAIAAWSDLDLSGINGDLGDLGPDFDIDLLGIKGFDIEVADKDLGDPDEVPEAPEEPKTKLGDIYQLGAHRLMCGDSTSIDAVEKLMGGEKADMMFTDPPYGMFLETNYDAMFTTNPNHRKTGERFENVKGDHEDFAPELINTVFAAFPDCREVFLWGADYYSDLLIDRKDGSWVVWDKRITEEMDRVSGNTFELCWSKQKHKRLIARIQWSGHHGMQKDDTKKRVHPTQKPAALAEWFFEQWGKPSDRVADLFGGSGSTLIACEKTGRKCFMMELNPKYCDVIVARWEKFTGKKAELLTPDAV